MINLKKLIFLLILAGIAYAAGFSTATYFAPAASRVEGLYSKELGKPEGVDFGLFWEAWNAIQEKHIKHGGFDTQALVYGAIKGLVGALEDPHSAFLTPEENKRFFEDISGSFEGVGIEISIRKGTLTVISPLKGTPADRAGLRAGDKIIKIDETNTSELTLDEAVSLIRGPKGTTVTLTVFRDTSDKTVEIPVIRDTIIVPVLEWEMKEPGVAYVQVFHFTEKTNEKLGEILPQMLNAGTEKIVLDLRNNPGGLLDVSVSVAGFFLEKNSLVVSERFADGRPGEELRTDQEGALKDIPLVVLVNKGTASAAEILAEALRVNRDVTLVGEKTFGKGSVQELYSLDSSSLKLTVAEWLTPTGESINENGLEPDIVIELTEEDFEAERDPQLDRALEIIRGL